MRIKSLIKFIPLIPGFMVQDAAPSVWPQLVPPSLLCELAT